MKLVFKGDCMHFGIEMLSGYQEYRLMFRRLSRDII